jgi:hypothetical protein
MKLMITPIPPKYKLLFFVSYCQIGSSTWRDMQSKHVCGRKQPKKGERIGEREPAAVGGQGISQLADAVPVAEVPWRQKIISRD